LITSAKNLEPEYKYLSLRLRLEEQRLFNWSSETGLLEHLHGDESIPRRDLMGLSRSTVLDTLIQIHALTVEFIENKDKYGGLVPDDGAVGDFEAHNEYLFTKDYDQLPRFVHFPKKTKLAKSVLHNWPKRLKWACFYKDDYEKLINKVRLLNDVLIDLVDSDARVAIRQSTRETNTTVLHLHTRIDELVQLTKALLPDGATSLSKFAFSMSQCGNIADIQEKGHFASLAFFKAVNTSVEDNTYFNLQSPAVEGRAIGDLKLTKSDFHILPNFEDGSNRCEAEYQATGRSKRRVWIEWREYDPISLAQPVLKPSRIDKLIALLSDPTKPELLRVPLCLGYFDDPRSKENDYRRGRLGFVFEKPTAMDGGPVSLRQLLRSQPRPLLTERVALAKAVSSCLMSLHSVNWLHKGLRSHNIIFFPEDPGERDYIDFSCPFLSGFGYARPAFREDMTELPPQNPEYDMYKHPKIQRLGPWEGRQGFKRTFDIYSLGIVFTEIANWQTIDSFLDLGNPKSLHDTDLAEIQTKLLGEKGYMQIVGAHAGSRFRDATLSCLDSKTALDVGFLDDEADVHVAAKLSRNFYHKVLRPLEEIVI